MLFNVLASGSEGNALVVQSSSRQTTVLLDCGLPIKHILSRLALAGLTEDQVSAIVVTHEHGDHLGSSASLAKRLSIPLYMSHGTAMAAKLLTCQEVDLRLCQSDQQFIVKDFQITPFTVPHDAREPLQFIFETDKKRLGVLTDVGQPTAAIAAVLQQCDSLVLESNHDQDMLAQSSYPASLKQRIQGDFGHLANHIANQLLAQLKHPRLNCVVAAHLSAQNNCPQKVANLFAQTLNRQPDDIVIALQHEITGWLHV